MGCSGSAGHSLPPPASSRFFDKYELAEVIGQGAFGEVRAARLHIPEHSAQGEDLAVKMVVFESEQGHKPEKLNSERDLWLKLGRHPNIVSLQAHFLDVRRSSSVAFFVMERCFGNLRDRLPQRHEFRGVLLDVLEAVTHVHSCGIVHRDIKLTNLLWSYTTVKLCDFGSAHELDANGFLTSTAGTGPYMSPELASGLPYGYPTDIWSSGVVVYGLLYKKFPFVPPAGRIAPEAFKRAVLHGSEPEYPPCAQGEDVVRLCRTMLRHTASARPTAPDALEQLRAFCSSSKDSSMCDTLSTTASGESLLESEVDDETAFI